MPMIFLLLDIRTNAEYNRDDKRKGTGGKGKERDRRERKGEESRGKGRENRKEEMRHSIEGISKPLIQ